MITKTESVNGGGLAGNPAADRSVSGTVAAVMGTIVEQTLRSDEWRKRLCSINMRHQNRTQKVISVIPEGASMYEAISPVGVWGPDRCTSAELDVDFTACGIESSSVAVEGGIRLSGLGVLADHIESADMVIIPTWPIHQGPMSGALIEHLLAAHARGARIVGLCLGAYAIASTGLLDGSSATTHWRQRTRFEATFPEIRFEPNVLYVDHDTIVTSAGSAAAVDCCLHLVRRDHGAEAAARVARIMVTAPHRSGGQSQFASAPPLTVGDDLLSRGLAIAAEDIAAIRGTSDLANVAGTSRRSLERAMNDRLGTTPRAWITEQRVTVACRLLETTELSVDQVATSAGYGSTPTLRRALAELRGTTPTAYRSMFRDRSASQSRANQRQ